MSTPQQPELARARRSAATPESAKTKARTNSRRTASVAGAPVPDDNEPGHHPAVDQDKPAGPPPRPGRAVEHEATDKRFGFAFQPALLPLSAAFGVIPATAHVRVGDHLEIRFGPWYVRTPIDNVDDAHVTGPYMVWKVAGPAHLSFKDRGVTFATTTKAGVCIRFKEPVPALLPGAIGDRLRHPAVTVTVDRPSELVDALRAAHRPGH